MTRTCPRCSLELIERDVDGIVVDLCEPCGGVFLDRGELAELATEPRLPAAQAAFPDAEAAPTGGAVYVACPDCGALMKRRKFASGIQVIVDECLAHGTWFDGAELARVLAFLGDGGAARAAAHDQARDLEERRRATTGGTGFPELELPERGLPRAVAFVASLLAPYHSPRRRRR